MTKVAVRQNPLSLLTLILVSLLVAGCGSAVGKSQASKAVLSVTPTSVSFGSDVTNNTATKTITLTNVGSSAIQVQKASLSNGQVFVLKNWTSSFSIAPGKSYGLIVGFTPPSTGSYSATLTIATNSNVDTVVDLGGTGVTSVSSVTISVSPTQASVQTGASQQFAATVGGTTNTGVNWAVNGFQGGNSTVGTISTSGLYVAPQTVPSGGYVTITGTSAADSTKSASSKVTVSAPATAISVSISPTRASLQTGTTQQFSAAVSGTSNTSVNWLVNGTQGGNATVGTISAAGLYSAPSTVPSAGSVNVSAVSAASSSSSASAAVTITAPSSLSVVVSPASASVAAGGKQQFSATVSGTTNQSVSWYVGGVLGGNSSVGTISSSGLYTAPACPAQTAQTVKAVSAYNTSYSATATVSLSGSSTASGNYYVATNGSDANNGSACSPWATITHADTVIGPGAVVHVAPGTYVQNISTSANGTASAPITFVSDTRWGAKIVGSADSIWLAYGSYVNIKGFDVSAANTIPRMGIYVNGGSHNKVVGNKVHDIVAATGGSNGGAAIEPGPGADYSEIRENFIYNIGVGTGNLHIQGIYVSSSQHHLVANNVVMNVAGWGIQLYHQPVAYVTIVNNTLVGNGGGIVIGSDGSGSTATDYNVVSNNILAYNSSEYGLRECCGTGNVGTHNTYSHNLFYSNSPSDWQSGMTTTPVSNVLANPGLVNYQPDGSGDYHLISGSPAVDAGTSSNASNIDFDGGVRPIGSGFDIGAYEYGTAPGSWPW